MNTAYINLVNKYLFTLFFKVLNLISTLYYIIINLKVLKFNIIKLYIVK